MYESLTAHAQQLGIMLSQHKEQIVFELSMVETVITSSESSLETIRSKLESLAATTSQLSSYHHSMETDISSTKCLDTDEGVQLHYNLQDNLSPFNNMWIPCQCTLVERQEDGDMLST